ncbi:hypothetical protein GPECTOR_1g437 [Gonium pectorale]|uniref:Protein kinase domain-containing protein n=1 Tax=Gonium pectorale TaxID=33097 RepID=A0A150H3U0_GONPE|nr:hypothetical protein GPECTOR_1g437 [Gonium pectorale]|eukprot:KXZ56488.1 hypothetical protein GPECTOR_1g437 [Gonium pectorale]
MALPLWFFNFNRSLGRPLLRLRNVTLVVPPAELDLLRRLLETADTLPEAPVALVASINTEEESERQEDKKGAEMPKGGLWALSYYMETREAHLSAFDYVSLPDEGATRLVKLSADCRFRMPSAPVAERPSAVRQAVDDWRAAIGGAAAEDDGAVRLLKRIGQGSYGVVFLGVWRGLAVAAKVLVVHDTLLGAEGRARQRAVLEAAVGASLDHPNVVATYAYDVRPLGEQPGDGGDEAGSDPRIGSNPDVFQLHILQEFCSGGSLKEALESRGVLGGGVLAGGVSAAVALRLAFDVAAGLRHVHATGIVHGDVSAGNVLLARRTVADDDAGSNAPVEDGPTDAREADWHFRLATAGPPPLRVVAKVADFGLSVRLPGSATHASGNVQGTPVYTAPEVLIFGRVSRASDVYSFGVLLLELLHGTTLCAAWNAARPGVQLTPAALVDQGTGASALVEALTAPLRASDDRCPAGLRALLEACLATDPAGRPTMEQVAEALVGCLQAVAGECLAQLETESGPAPARE